MASASDWDTKSEMSIGYSGEDTKWESGCSELNTGLGVNT